MTVNPFFQRLNLITGTEAAAALEKSRALVFGLGGVGSWCAEALVRSGIGKISLVDSDRVSASNINRQAEATSRTVGRLKTDALKERLEEINPSCIVTAFPKAFSKETSALFDIPGADYVIDAIDTLTYKLDLIEITVAAETCFFSSMGMAQKLDPLLIRTADIWETRSCPLARLVRQGLRKRNFSGHFTVVYSPERLPVREGPLRKGPIQEDPGPSGESGAAAGEGDGGADGWDSRKKVINGSAVTVTAAAGLVLASLVIRDIYARYAPVCADGG